MKGEQPPAPSSSSTPISICFHFPVFALTLLGLLALAQARIDYKLQCTRDEVGIRWPSYYSNSEYYVCQSVYGSQLTVHCPAGQVFTFVLQQCAAPALYVPAPPMDVLPTAAPITTHLVDEAPPVLASVGGVQPIHAHEPAQEQVVHALPLDPTPPTPPTEPPTPPTVAVEAPKPGKKPTAPQPPKAAAPKKPAAKKPAAPAPPKAAKKPTPPSKAQKKPPTQSSA